MQVYGSFLALEQRPGISNLYKIYVTETALCGAVVAGKYASETSARALRYADSKLSKTLYACIKSREENIRYYDATEIGGPVFLSGNRANFSIGPALIERTSIRPLHWFSKIMTQGTDRFGNLYLFPRDGRKRHFALFGEQDIDIIADMLRPIMPSIEMRH